MSNQLQLPRTSGCMVCGNENPHGLKLTSFVDRETGTVATSYTIQPHHIGFQGILHGGITATVLDEVMVWASTWNGKRFCLAGEITIRYRKPVAVGTTVNVIAKVVGARGRVLTASAQFLVGDVVVAEGTGKYIQVSPEQHAEMVATFVDEAGSREAALLLK